MGRVARTRGRRSVNVARTDRITWPGGTPRLAYDLLDVV
jgi:hypothetical protein